MRAGKLALASLLMPQVETRAAQRFARSLCSLWSRSRKPHYQVTVLTLELDSPTLPPSKKLVFVLADTAKLAETKKNPIIIKEGVEYK